MSSLKWEGDGLKILDFDLECRPLSWYGGDFVTKEITAIAAKFNHQRKAHCFLLGKDDPEEMLIKFLALYNEADMVTGHFIRAFDLPVLNGSLAEYKMPLLEDKLAHDTKLDLKKRSGISGSQESIAGQLGIASPKVQMDQAKWREANRLTPKGIALTRKRAVGDIIQHREMRDKLIELDYLKPPSRWSSSSGARRGKYTP